MNTSEQLCTADEAAAVSTQIVGGKGYQLGLLRQRGLPVPDFLVIPAYWSQFWSETLPTRLPTELEVLLTEAIAQRGWESLPLAVRSSAVGEDAAAASFAGVFVSKLNVIGAAQLQSAVTEVWASLHSATARAYRERMGLSSELAMAVVIMPLLPAVASGIAFTCDPITGREDRIIVHANWGLGETLVGGETSGDEYQFAEDTTDVWRLIVQKTGNKTLAATPIAHGGTDRQAIAASQSTQAIFNTAQAETLAALLRDAALACDFVAPFYDLEWVWDGSQFWLTQARPITRLPRNTYTDLQHQPALWTRGNTCEVMPEPLQAMDWSSTRRGCNDLLEQGWKLTGMPLQPGIQRAGLFDGRLYLDASILQREAWYSIGLPPVRFNALMGGHQPGIATQTPSWQQKLQRVVRMLNYIRRAPKLAKQGDQEIIVAHAIARELRTAILPANNDDIVALLHRVLRPARESLGMFFLQGSGGGSLSLLLDTLNRYLPGEGAALGAALLAGGAPSVTAKQGYALLALAQQAKQLVGEQQPWPAITNTESPDFMAAWQPWLADAAFAKAFADFMDQYGHRGHYETYLRSPRWSDKPALILVQLPALANVSADSLRQRQQNATVAAWQRVRRELPFWIRPIIRAQVKAATRDSNRREGARSALMALLAVGRHLWLQIGERFVIEEVIATPEDIFHFMPSEVERYARGLLPKAGLKARLAERQQRFAAWQVTTPADWFWQAHDQTLAPPPARDQQPGSDIRRKLTGKDIWYGVATGTGVAIGHVRRLNHPAEGHKLQPGDILLASSTDPGWTPLFLKASGMVVETGGYMSHGAIVAREFALPTVVNLPGILATLKDGDLVEVDGTKGTVRRC